MPRNKDLKRLVRARMTKTGEAYTTARAQITAKPRARKTSAPAPTIDYAAVAGMSDAIIKEKTGCNWEKWIKSLDHHGALSMTHTDIAKLVRDKYKVDGWWAQSVTVGYERIKGLRARGQRRDGSYEATKSRTFNVSVSELFNAWEDSATRRTWMDGTTLKVRTATAPRSMRLSLPDGGTVTAWFLDKGKSKSSVAVAHTKLPDKETADRFKEYWSERLDALKDVLVARKA